jgi:hypothetical protein
MTTERSDGGEGILHIPSKIPTYFNYTPGPFHSPSPVGRGLRLGTTLPAMVVAAASQFAGERPHPNPLRLGEGTPFRK